MTTSNSDELVTWHGVEQSRRDYLETQMWVLTVRGVDEQTIMDTLGVSRELLHRSVSAVANRRRNSTSEERRIILDAAYERLKDALWEQAERGSKSPLDGVLRILQGQRELWGTDAPKKLDMKVSVKDEVEQAFANLEATLLGDEDIVDAEIVEPLEIEAGHGD